MATEQPLDQLQPCTNARQFLQSPDCKQTARQRETLLAPSQPTTLELVGQPRQTIFLL